MNYFKPSKYLTNYNEFNPTEYKDRGFKAVFIDIDNTIAIPKTGVCDKQAELFIKKISDSGLIPVVFSNNTKNRVKKFVRDLDVEYYYLALKPLPFSYISLAKKLNVKTSEVVVIGDQLITDILGANLSGCYGIYVKQLMQKDSFFTTITRPFEQYIWRKVKDEKM